MNRRILHDVAMATTKAICEQFLWPDEAAYNKAFSAVLPAIEGGLLYLVQALRRDAHRRVKPDPFPTTNDEEDR